MLLLVCGLATTAMAIDQAEIEPNESKALALANGVYVLEVGDALVGSTTGVSTTTPGASSADYFLVRTTPAPLGIYRHRLTITTAGTGTHVGSLRGLPSSSSGAGVGDSSFLVSVASSTGTTPPRTCQWYGFGRQERVFYRVTGTQTTTAPYRAQLSTDVVATTTFTSRIPPGIVSIYQAASTDAAYDRELFLFDDNLNPIVAIDDNDSLPLTASVGVGVYHLAYGRNNTAVGPFAGAVNAFQTGGIQGNYQTGAVLDFADAVASSSSVSASALITLSIETPSGTFTATAPPPTGSFDIAWFTFFVCAPCVGNFDNTGGVNAADIAAYFAAYEEGLLCADADRDGGITGNDVAAFFRAFENGGC